MLIYIIKFSACLTALLIFYKLFLERESIHVFKRFYLLAALVFSSVVPTLVFTEYVVSRPSTDMVIQPITYSNEVINVPLALESDILDVAPLIWGIYFLGLIFFGIKFIKNLFQIFRRIRNNPKQRAVTFVRVLLHENFPPHTFFKYIFLNKVKLESNEIPKEVLIHEETHAKQKHSLDVLFIELLQIVMWFNPLIYFMRKSIKLNHEFLADKAVLKKGIASSTYQNTLLSFMTPIQHQSLANAINYSSIKKRFTVMKKNTSKKSIWLRSIALLPLLAILLLSFSDKVAVINHEESKTTVVEVFQEKVTPEMVSTYNVLAKKYNKQPKETRIVPIKDLRVLEDIYRKMTEGQKDDAQPFPEYPIQDGASRKLMAEYNKLAKYYNNMPKKKMKVLGKDVKRLEYIHGLMSEKQKADTEPFPDFPSMPEPPPPPPVPEVAVIGTAKSVSPSRALAPTVVKGEVSSIQPLQPPTPDAPVIAGTANVPPPPPPPKSPLQFVKEMIEQDAIFYYNGKKIGSKKAVELLESSGHISLKTRHTGLKRPKVELSDKPIVIEN